MVKLKNVIITEECEALYSESILYSPVINSLSEESKEKHRRGFSLLELLVQGFTYYDLTKKTEDWHDILCRQSWSQVEEPHFFF